MQSAWALLCHCYMPAAGPSLNLLSGAKAADTNSTTNVSAVSDAPDNIRAQPGWVLGVASDTALTFQARFPVTLA